MCFGRQFYTPPTKERGTIQNDEKSFSFLLILGVFIKDKLLGGRDRKRKAIERE